MAEQYMSELRVFPFNFAPKGWALCNGQLLPINQNQALFALLGVTYGGNGTTTFGLPNLMGRTMVHLGQSPISGANYVPGEFAGVENVTLLPTQIPLHTHIVMASSQKGGTNVTATSKIAMVQNSGAITEVINCYAPAGSAGATTLAPAAISNFGSSQPHSNMPPFLVMSVCIALTGIFPTRN